MIDTKMEIGRSNITNYASDLEDINDLVLKNNALTFVFLAFLIVFGIVGNGFSLAFYGFVEKKTVTSFLIIVLATSDLVSSVIFIEQMFVLSFMLDFPSRFACSLIRFLKTICIGNSLLLLGPVGLERCLKICNWNPRYRLTWMKAAILSASLIVFSVLRSVRQFFTNDIKNVNIHIGNVTVLGKICTKNEDEALTPIIKLFDAIDAVCFTAINIVIIVVYLLIIRKVTLVQRRVNTYPSRAGFTENNPTSLSERSSIKLKKQAGKHAINQNTLKIQHVTTNSTGQDFESLGQIFTTQFGASNVFEDVTESGTLSIYSKRKQLVQHTDKSSDKICLDKHTTSDDETREKNANKMEKKPKLVGQNSQVGSKVQQTISVNISSPNNPLGNKVETNLNIMLTVVAFSSLLCYLPYAVILYTVGPTEVYTKYSLNALVQIGWRSPLLNSSINPYVIGLFNSKFRHFVKRVLRYCRR